MLAKSARRVVPSSLLCCLAVISCDRWAGEHAASQPAHVAQGSSLPRPANADARRLSSFDDRANFRRWFTAIAEMQFYRISDAWNPEQRDCAGCIRFAWREALRVHDRAWLLKMGTGYEAWAPDVRAFANADGSRQSKLFRTTAATVRGDSRPDSLSDFADAQTLLKYNSTFISRDRARAMPGDLLFFHQPWTQKYPFHVMLFLGPALHEGHGATDWVVYHTGSSPEDSGTVKKVRLAMLDRHPDERWRPVETNPNFMGYYRLDILE